MSPLILVGILVLTTLNHSLADVKHVLDGSAHPPTCKCADENHHHYQHHHQDNQFNGGFSSSGSFDGTFGGLPPNLPGSPNNVVPGSVAFWWADSNSPFKHAYEYFKKCSEKGNCLPPVSPGIQVSNTIQHGGVSASVDSHKGVSGSTPSPFGPVDIKKNPFFNGQINGVSGAGVTPQGGGQINLGGNPFFSGQAAYSGTGETVVTGSDGFLGVQPSVPFGKTQPKPFTQNHPIGGVGVSQQPFPTALPSGGLGGNQAFQPFPTTYPGAQASKDGKFENCKRPGHVCVPPQLCINGIVKNNGEGLLGVRQNVEYCEIGKEVCCLLPEGEGTSYHPSQQSRGQFSSSFASSSGLTHTGFANLSHITTGKSSVPGGSIKFSGSPGLSPGLIQVLPIGEEAPNPYISTAGESGSGIAHSGSSSTTKVARDTTPSPNSVFSSTPDYSNDNLRGLTFLSTIKGPDYLPPVDSSHISTYQPSVPTTSRPFVTKPIIPGSSIVSVYTPPSTPKPFVPSFSVSTTQRPFTFSTFSTTQRPFIPSSTYTPYKPFVPSSPKPFDLPKQPQNVFPTYTPRPQTNTPNQYLPPHQPSPSPSQNTYASFPTRPSVSYTTQAPFTRQPTYSSSYLPPQTPARPTLPPYSPPTPYKPTYVPPYKPSPQPSQTVPQVTNTYVPPTYKPTTSSTYKPYSPSTYKPYNPSVTTGGYKYPTPTPAFEYPTPKPDGSINANNNYIPPKQPTPSQGYSYPTPTPAFTYGPSTPKPIIPSSSVTFTNTYVPPRTTPKPFTFTNYVPPKTTPKPVTFPHQSTPGYSYPTPTPTFGYPKQPSTPKPDYSFNNNYYTPTSPKPTPQPYYTQSTSGYHYPTPTPTFVYPSPSPSTQQPTRRPTNNGYLPPEERPDGTNVNDQRVPYPTTKYTTQAPTYIPPLEGEPNIPSISVIRPDQPQPSACAAALKCVQEIYCTADGFISSTPVVLSKEQEYLRVPTTDCVDSGVVGKCCRDPSYVDPWPSANLINGIDNGQYREDPTLGQYFPQKQRPARSESSTNIQNSLLNNGIKQRQPVQQPARIPEPFNTPAVVAAASNNDKNCGIRNSNIQPHGSGALDAGFAEIPWQAMILRDTNRSLLCGGVIVKPNAVVTAAHCLEGLETSDILIKAGEWKLGIDEEPLPFQIEKVAAIIRHPNYQPGVKLNDLAVLVLENRLRIVQNVGPICLPANNQPPPSQTQCIVTGWGKHVLQVHLRDAIMRLVDVNILDNKQCSATLNNKYQHILQHYSQQDTICAYSSQDQCKVDYGSALACTNENGQYTLAGIFSWDTGCKDESQIGGYIPPDVEWIESTCSKPLTQLKAIDRQYRNNHQ